jgi:hypothetical protein
MITAKQNRALGAIARAALESTCARDRADLKDWRVEPIGRGVLFVVVEAGKLADEGTMAAVLCRTRGTFTVGPRGSIRSTEAQPHGKRGRRSNARRYPLIYGFTS